MADYTIRKSNGDVLGTITAGQLVANKASITFVGQGKINYGETLQNDFFHMLENFASDTRPDLNTHLNFNAPLAVGQLWYDTNSGVLNIYNGTTFVPLALESDVTTGSINQIKEAAALS